MYEKGRHNTYIHKYGATQINGRMQPGPVKNKMVPKISNSTKKAEFIDIGKMMF
jgi:hypothetical protein